MSEHNAFANRRDFARHPMQRPRELSRLEDLARRGIMDASGVYEMELGGQHADDVEREASAKVAPRRSK